MEGAGKSQLLAPETPGWKRETTGSEAALSTSNARTSDASLSKCRREAVATNPSVYPQLVQLQIWSIFLGALLIDVDISSNVTSWDETIFDMLLVITKRPDQTNDLILKDYQRNDFQRPTPAGP